MYYLCNNFLMPTYAMDEPTAIDKGKQPKKAPAPKIVSPKPSQHPK